MNLYNYFGSKEITYNFARYHRELPKLFPDKNIEDKIRFDNLKLLCQKFNNYDVKYWLFGKTLLQAVKCQMERDHDDDLGIDEASCDIVFKTIIPELVKTHGFTVIRTMRNSMVSIMRDNRYIDICVFSKTRSGYGYEKKHFPQEWYAEIITTPYDEFAFSVPKEYSKILKQCYNVDI